jgi:WNK lysine deficient protein kinase
MEQQQQQQQQQQPFEKESTSDENGVVEVSPNKRYIRFENLLYSNEIKSTNKAFDTKNGVEVAWHTINLNSLKESEQMGVTQCVNIIKMIQCDYIIEYLACWFGVESSTLNIITTKLQTLRDFFSKVKTLRWRIVKKWCKQILKGLDHLHSRTPAIIHRSLNCSHIYIDSGFSSTNIGALWSSAILIPTNDNNKDNEDNNDNNNNNNNTNDLTKPFIGLSDDLIKQISKTSSPSFNPPELFEAQPLSTKSDIYSFGMCVLHILTRNEPYKECNNSYSKISSKVLAGVPPLDLNRVINPLAHQFITECLKPKDERPSASDLIEHLFLVTTEEDDNEVTLGSEIDISNDDNIDNDNNDKDIYINENNKDIKNNNFIDSIDYLSNINNDIKFKNYDNVTGLENIFVGDLINSHHQSKDELGGNTTTFSNRLSKELAAFELGENVYIDKGIHDGRREFEEIDNITTINKNISELVNNNNINNITTTTTTSTTNIPSEDIKNEVPILQLNNNNNNNNELDKNNNELLLIEESRNNNNTIINTFNLESINGDNIDEIELLNEMEKLEKDSRVAKRAFEQRIQKLLFITTFVEEEYKKIDQEYEKKKLNIKLKEETLIKKKETDLLLINEIKNKKIQEYKNNNNNI